MNKLLPTGLLLAGLALLAAPRAARAQADPHVYTYAQPMPELVGGGGMEAVKAAIMQRLKLPAGSTPGMVFVGFVVYPDGHVDDVKIIKGLSPGMDAAVVEATRHLPAFVPGRLDGQPVKVSLQTGLRLLLPPLAPPTARQATPPAGPTYSFVEQMPALPEGGGTGAIQQAVVQRVKVPAGTPPDQLTGRIQVRFVVTAEGQATEATILQGSYPALNNAVLAAVAALPRLVPGQQNGQPVRVYETIPVQLAPPPNGQTFAERNESDSLRVYTYVEQMPTLPGGGGQAAIVDAMQQRLIVPADTPDGRVFVKFTVGPSGSIYGIEIAKGLNATADAAALAAVRQLPRLVPGQQNGRKVAVNYTLPLTFGTRPPRPTGR